MKLPKLHLTGTTAINAAGAFVIIYLLVVLVQTVKHNYDLSGQIDSLKSQISLLQDQKTALSDSIAYYQTDSYRDRQARSQLGLQLPGENVVIIPGSNSAAADAPSGKDQPGIPIAQRAAPKSNVQQWMSFLTGG